MIVCYSARVFTGYWYSTDSTIFVSIQAMQGNQVIVKLYVYKECTGHMMMKWLMMRGDKGEITGVYVTRGIDDT